MPKPKPVMGDADKAILGWFKQFLWKPEKETQPKNLKKYVETRGLNVETILANVMIWYEMNSSKTSYEEAARSQREWLEKGAKGHRTATEFQDAINHCFGTVRSKLEKWIKTGCRDAGDSEQDIGAIVETLERNTSRDRNMLRAQEKEVDELDNMVKGCECSMARAKESVERAKKTIEEAKETIKEANERITRETTLIDAIEGEMSGHTKGLTDAEAKLVKLNESQRDVNLKLRFLKEIHGPQVVPPKKRYKSTNDEVAVTGVELMVGCDKVVDKAERKKINAKRDADVKEKETNERIVIAKKKVCLPDTKITSETPLPKPGEIILFRFSQYVSDRHTKNNPSSMYAAGVVIGHSNMIDNTKTPQDPDDGPYLQVVGYEDGRVQYVDPTQDNVYIMNDPASFRKKHEKKAAFVIARQLTLNAQDIVKNEKVLTALDTTRNALHAFLKTHYGESSSKAFMEDVEDLVVVPTEEKEDEDSLSVKSDDSNDSTYQPTKGRKSLREAGRAPQHDDSPEPSPSPQPKRRRVQSRQSTPPTPKPKSPEPTQHEEEFYEETQAFDYDDDKFIRKAEYALKPSPESSRPTNDDYDSSQSQKTADDTTVDGGSDKGSADDGSDKGSESDDSTVNDSDDSTVNGESDDQLE